MPILDIIIVILVVGALVMGYRKGIFAQAGSLFGLILGFITARMLGMWCARIVGQIARHMAENPEPAMYEVAIGYVIMFIVGYMIARVIAHFLRDLTHALQLGILDRLAGAVWTVFEWLFVFSLVLNLFCYIRPTDLHAYTLIAHGSVVDFIYHLAPGLLGFPAA